MNSNRQRILGGQDRDLPYGTAEQAAENSALLSGHDFSRAAQSYKDLGFKALHENRDLRI
jgi:hypothetical protein